jgi:hypothetical protein
LGIIRPAHAAHNRSGRFAAPSVRVTILPMLVLVISDIHANLTALDRVLEDARSFDAVWCLGTWSGTAGSNECIGRSPASTADVPDRQS